jgi:integrase
MPRPATGSVEYRNRQWWGRVAGADGRRVRVYLGDWPNSPQGKERAQDAALAWREKLRERRLGALPRGALGRRPQPSTETCEPWFEAWIADRKARGHTSTPENETHYQRYVLPSIGPKHIRHWTPDDFRALSRELDRRVQAGECSWKTALNVWGTATKMASDACSSKLDLLRVREDNPAFGVAGPDRGPEKAKQYLYPSEFARFVERLDVPLAWRRATTLAIYLFPRASELRVLRWEDVDLEHATIHIHRSRDRNTGEEKPTKTGSARRFSIEPTVLPLLRAMHDEKGGQGIVIDLPSERDMARGFRRWLKNAGVDRAELHASSRTRKAIRFHDLRATGLTWMAVRGDDPLKIMQRAGHTDFQTTQLYVREAEAVRDRFGEVFPSLPSSLLDESGGGGWHSKPGNGGGVLEPTAAAHAVRPRAVRSPARVAGPARRTAHPTVHAESPRKRTGARTIAHLRAQPGTGEASLDVLDPARFGSIVHSGAGSSPVRPANCSTAPSEGRPSHFGTGHSQVVAPARARNRP